MAEEPFDIVIPTNFALNPGGIRDVVLSIRETYPLVGIVVVSGWWDTSLEMPFGPVDAFYPTPGEFEVLANTFKAIGKIPRYMTLQNHRIILFCQGWKHLLIAQLDKCHCRGKIENCYWCKGTGTVMNSYFPWEDIDACPNMEFRLSFLNDVLN